MEESRRADLSYEVRILLCPGCSAPYRSAPTATTVTCDHCGATHAVAPRNERREVVGAASADERERIAALRKQDANDVVIPQRFAKILPKTQFDDDDRATVERGFTEAREAITSGKGDAGWDLCLYSATWFHFTVAMGTDITGRRAHAETALGLLEDPAYRHRVRCKLAGSTARLGDVEAAAHWLAGCDPRPADLVSDSEYRNAAIMIAYRRGRFDEILEIAGHEFAEVPVHVSLVNAIGTMRADAHEKLGHVDRAVDQLVILVSRNAEAVTTLASRADLAPFCEKSLPAARARVAAIEASTFNVDSPHVVCDSCGADFEIRATTTEARCPYCNAISAVSLRAELTSKEGAVGAFPGARDLRYAQLEKLISQRVEVVIPPDLAHLFHDGRIAPAQRAEAEAAWRREVRRVAEGDEPRAAALVLLTTALLGAERDTSAAGRRRDRATLETALRVLREPGHLATLRCTVAVLAAEAGDFEAASMWLARCDPSTSSLEVYSALALAHAKIANLRGDFAETVRLLGTRDGDAPVPPQRRVLVAAMRAAALEALGREREAIASLTPIIRAVPGGPSALAEVSATLERNGEPAPKRSVPRAIAERRRTQLISWAMLVAVCVVVVVAFLLLRR